MKKSNKILWGSFVGLLGITAIFLIVLRVLLSENLEATDATDIRKTYGSREIAMVDFTGIDLQGYWNAEVFQGSKERIVVEGPEDLLATLSVRRRGESLTLKMAKHRDARKLHAVITMPALHSLRAKGVIDVTLSSLDTERISIHAEGVVSLLGKKGHIGDLHLRGRGVSKMDLGDIPVRTADLDCKGVIKINLTMDGGELTGSLKGIGELRYAGEASHESIQKKGSCKVTREIRS